MAGAWDPVLGMRCHIRLPAPEARGNSRCSGEEHKEFPEHTISGLNVFMCLFRPQRGQEGDRDESRSSDGAVLSVAPSFGGRGLSRHGPRWWQCGRRGPAPILFGMCPTPPRYADVTPRSQAPVGRPL